MADVFDRLNAALAGRYQLKREQGQVGMATVFLAHDLKHDLPVALDVPPSVPAAPIAIGRLLAKIRLIARLKHPHAAVNARHRVSLPRRRR